MSPSSTHPAPEVIAITAPNRPTISWGSVVAGMFTAIAVQIALAELCISCGLAMYSPFDSAGTAATIATTTIAAWLICSLIALFLGGWVAGRLAHYHSRMTAALHGVLVWATGAVVAAVLVATTLGMIAGGTMSLVGDGLNAAARGAQAAGSTVSAIAAPTWDAMKKQVDDASSKVAASAQPGTADNRLADQSRMMDLFGKFFTVAKDKPLAPAEKDELVTLVAGQVGISREAALKTVDQWQSSWNAAVARYEAAMVQAKETATQAANTAKKYTASAAGIGFLLMLVGLVAAALGGFLGSMCFRCEDQRIANGVAAQRAPTAMH